MTHEGLLERIRPAHNGLRRFDPGRDLSAVVRLLELGFQHDLEAADYRWLAELEALASAGPLLSLIMGVVPRAASSFGGLVWYEDGRLIGNVSLVRSTPDVWVIANVVTAPEYRRRGIGRHMMEAAIRAAHERGAEQVQLQVRTDNAAAQTLYRQLGFWHMNTATILRLQDLRSAVHGPHVRRNGPRALASGATLMRWGQDAVGQMRRLLARTGHGERGGPPSLVSQTVTGWGWQGRLDDWMRGRTRYGWAAAAGGEYRGVAVAVTNVSIPHRVELLVEPRWRGYIEAPLVSVALQTLDRHGQAVVEAEIDVRETGAMAALELAGFQRVRTLDRLALDLAG